MTIDPLFASVALIVQISGTNIIGSATGFFFQVETNKYLVSNRHVFTGESLPPGVPRPDTIVLPLHSNPSNLVDAVFLRLPIKDTNGSPLWCEHPLGSKVDVAMLPLDGGLLKATIVHWLSNADFPPESYSANPGQDLFVMGFPQGFHDRLFHLPIIRTASVASAYGVPFEGSQMFFIDAKLHPGTSGSPVFSKPTRELDGGMGIQFGGRPIIHLVGINSGELKPLPGQTEMLGLHAVWYPSLLMDIHSKLRGMKTAAVEPPTVIPITEILQKHGYSLKYLDQK